MFLILPYDSKLQTLIDCLEVGHQNIYSEYDEDVVEAIYEMATEDYEERTVVLRLFSHRRGQEAKQFPDHF